MRDEIRMPGVPDDTLACPVCAGGHAGCCDCSSLSVRLWVRGWKILSKQSSWKINKLWTTLRWQFEKSHVLIPPVLKGAAVGKDYLLAVLLCNSLCKQFWWNKLTLRCSLTLPAAWEMIRACYWAKQPPATLGWGTWWHPVFMADLWVYIWEREELDYSSRVDRKASAHIKGLRSCHHNRILFNHKSSWGFKSKRRSLSGGVK